MNDSDSSQTNTKGNIVSVWSALLSLSLSPSVRLKLGQSSAVSFRMDYNNIQSLKHTKVKTLLFVWSNRVTR